MSERIINDFTNIIQLALQEDIGDGDISAQLVEDKVVTATIITREPGIYCGQLWTQAFNGVIQQQAHSPSPLIQKGIELRLTEYQKDADRVYTNDCLLSLQGNLRGLLSIERTLLNGLQLLCGIASKTHQFVSAVANTKCIILDTRKTIPGWRQGQKYAVRKGGGKNHRLGLYDAYLLKENHQMTQQSVSEMIHRAKQQVNQAPVFVEVESLAELKSVLPHRPQQVLLDNFSLTQLAEAVQLKQQHKAPCVLEASGNVDLHNVRQVAATGVDAISIGALTKNITAIDLSMRINHPQP